MILQIVPQTRVPDVLRIDHEDAAMLAAMLTGDRSYLQHRVRAGFERTGSFHLLVVSGLHLAIFSSIIFWLAQRLRLPRIWASLVTIVCSFGYAMFTGFGQPVERAFWMVTLYLIGRLLWRERVALNTIGMVALVMLAADPSSLFDSGLQMTLLSVLAIAGIASPVAEKTFGPYLRAMRNLRVLRIDPALPPRLAQFRVSIRMLAQHLRPLTGQFLAWKAVPFAIRLALRTAELLVVSLSIELFMMLPMVVYFHRVTLLALPVNLLIVPFLGLLLPCALLTFAVLLVWPSALLSFRARLRRRFSTRCCESSPSSPACTPEICVFRCRAWERFCCGFCWRSLQSVPCARGVSGWALQVRRWHWGWRSSSFHIR